jgi:hypothetical protein
MTHLIAQILCLVAAQAGPVGYWRGDDGVAPTVALDSSGNNRNGAYTVGATTATTPLPPPLANNASAFQLDGATGQVTVPHNTAFNLTGDMTVAFWMRRAAAGSDFQRMVGKGASAVRTFGIWVEAAADSRVLFQQYNGTSGSVLDMWTVEKIGLTTWKHIACTISGTGTATVTAKTYFDGVEKATATRTAIPGIDTQPVRFGYGEIHAFFPGLLDDVRLYNRALTLAQIQLLFQGGTEPTTAPAVNLVVSPGTAALSWAAVPNAVSYTIERSVAGGAFAQIASVTVTSYTDTGLTPGVIYSYRVTPVSVSAGPVSNLVSDMIPFPPPRTNDHDEGLLDGGCECGTARGIGAWPALLALALLAFARKP